MARGQRRRVSAPGFHIFPDGQRPTLNPSQTNGRGRAMATGHPVHVYPGRIEVITGPMFSGKSEELIRRMKRAQIAKRRVACFKPDLDARYHRTAIASHSAQTLDAVTVANVEEMKAVLMPMIDEIEVIGVDEAQFLGNALVKLANE